MRVSSPVRFDIFYFSALIWFPSWSCPSDTVQFGLVKKSLSGPLTHHSLFKTRNDTSQQTWWSQKSKFSGFCWRSLRFPYSFHSLFIFPFFWGGCIFAEPIFPPFSSHSFKNAAKVNGGWVMPKEQRPMPFAIWSQRRDPMGASLVTGRKGSEER